MALIMDESNPPKKRDNEVAEQQREFFKDLVIKASYNPAASNVIPPNFSNATKELQEKFQGPQPYNLGGTSQGSSKDSILPPLMPMGPSLSVPKQEPEQKFSIRGVLTGLSYHVDDKFHHATYDHGGTIDKNHIIKNPEDGKLYYAYIPNNQPYNKYNFGALVGVSINRSDTYTKGFNFDPRDAELFGGYYQNSYSKDPKKLLQGDPTVVAGVNYTPFNYKVESETFGDYLVKAGVSAGVAYTGRGTYQHDGIQLFSKQVTAEATGLIIAKHIKSGLGLQFNVVPPLGHHYGMGSVSLSYELDKLTNILKKSFSRG